MVRRDSMGKLSCGMKSASDQKMLPVRGGNSAAGATSCCPHTLPHQRTSRVWRRYNMFRAKHESYLHQPRINMNLFVQYKLQSQTVAVENA
jgi:hypothetical protein